MTRTGQLQYIDYNMLCIMNVYIYVDLLYVYMVVMPKMTWYPRGTLGTPSVLSGVYHYFWAPPPYVHWGWATISDNLHFG